MNQIKRYFSFNVWSKTEVVVNVMTALLILAVPTFTPLTLSYSGAVAGVCGALLLRHLALHGWTFRASNGAQRTLLVVLWLSAIIIGGSIATVLGL